MKQKQDRDTETIYSVMGEIAEEAVARDWEAVAQKAIDAKESLPTPPRNKRANPELWELYVGFAGIQEYARGQVYSSVSPGEEPEWVKLMAKIRRWETELGTEDVEVRPD